MNDQTEILYERARQLDPEARAALLEEALRGDPRLRDELLSLLREADAAETFFRLFHDAVDSGRFSIHELEDEPNGDSTTGRTPFVRSEFHTGAVIGHYRILSVIGRGGMGTVYRAEDTVLEREVALKFLPPLSTRLDDEERLLKEARSAGSLEHPNVCTIHEVGQTDDGRPFIAMALYEGETLKERLARGPLTVEEAVTIGVQIARGLAVAHARDILHRDVKPGNVIVGTDGTTRLLDFGLATITNPKLRPAEGNPGTLAYMSPEQIRGEALDARTDLWSLGVILYELLTGRRPFRGNNDDALLRSILEEEPKLISERAAVPEPLARIVARLLSKQRSSRYRSADEVVSDLREAVPSRSESHVASRARSRRALLIASVGALAALLGISFWLPGKVGQFVPFATNAPTEPSIAVLPLADLSVDPVDAPLANGMTETLIATLAGTGDMRVIGSTSVFALKGSRNDVRAIADRLGVSNILEGSFQKIDSRFRVQVRLVDARNGSIRWSQSYDREFEDVFLVQDEIARAVGGELEIRFDKDRQLIRHGARNLAAYELYLRGWDPALSRSEAGAQKRLGYFRQAIAVDSTYAAAHAGLASAYLRLGLANDPELPLSRLYRLAEESAKKAITLDESLAEAHYALGKVQLFTYDFPSAEAEINRAIALDPTRSVYRLYLAPLHLWAGRYREGLSETRRALEMDPLNPYAHGFVAAALFFNRRYDEALGQLDSLAATQPPLAMATEIAGASYAKKEMWPEALATLRPRADAGEPAHLALLGHTLARAGQREEAKQILADLINRSERTGSGAFEVAVVQAGLGDFDQAFAWLDRSIDDLSLKVSIMQPTFEDLRRDPRFERFRTRLRLGKQ